MSIKDAKPSKDYELLRKQFFALKRVVESQEAQIHIYLKRISEFRVGRIIELEAEVESQKQMNAILTEELETKLKG
jgi:hypothetical protein